MNLYIYIVYKYIIQYKAFFYIFTLYNTLFYNIKYIYIYKLCITKYNQINISF